MRGLRAVELLRLLLVASIAGPALVIGLLAWLTYQSAFADAEREIGRIAEVGREHAAKVFDSYGLLTDRIQDSLVGLDDAHIRAVEKSLHDKFVDIIRGLPQVQSFVVLDRNAKAVVATGMFPVSTVTDFSDRDYYIALRGGATDYVSRVQVSRISGKMFFGWGRSRRTSDGTFDGVIDIAISPDFFTRFYETLVNETGADPNGRVVSMVRADGQILVRYPAIQGNLPEPSPSSPFAQAIQRSTDGGTYKSRSVVDPGSPKRLFAYRKVPGHSIYIVAGRSLDAIIGEWLQGLIPYLVLAVPGTITLFLVTLGALRGARREHEALAQARQEMERRESIEAQLRQSQKVEAIGQLTGGIAHDFNNLLTVIRSCIDLLRRPDLSTERRERYMDAISETTSRGAKLTGQLLAFARRQALKPETLNVVESLNAIVEIVRSLTGSGIVIETHFPETPLFINVDRSQFDTSIVNMAVNARDAMNGEGRLTINVGSASAIPARPEFAAIRGDFVVVSIADTGSGIAPDMLERIFEPFFTTKAVGQGTGLGLSQVFGFAKQSAGEITVDSQVGRGTTFTLYMPSVVGALQTPDGGDDLAAPTSGEGIRVLVVEDNADVGNFATHALAELGYTTIWAASGEKALAELAEDAYRFDVVFSDVVMPGMSGIELGREIRRRHSNIPIVLTSGYSDALAQNGAAGFELLHKPYSVAQLSQTLSKAAKLRRG